MHPYGMRGFAIGSDVQREFICNGGRADPAMQHRADETCFDDPGDTVASANSASPNTLVTGGIIDAVHGFDPGGSFCGNEVHDAASSVPALGPTSDDDR